MLKSSEASNGEPEMRTIVSPCAMFTVHSFCRSTSNVTGSSAAVVSRWSRTLAEIRSRQFADGR